MKVHKYVMPAIVIIALLGVIYGAKAAGYWRTLPPAPVAGAASSAERPDPGAIKGYMTLDDVVATYGVPREALYAAIKAPADVDAKKPLKELKSVMPDFETEAVREFVQQYYDGTSAP